MASSVECSPGGLSLQVNGTERHLVAPQHLNLSLAEWLRCHAAVKVGEGEGKTRERWGGGEAQPQAAQYAAAAAPPCCYLLLLLLPYAVC